MMGEVLVAHRLFSVVLYIECLF